MIYRPDVCGYCGAETWCDVRQNGKPQCRACEVIRFFEFVLYPPFGYHMDPWVRQTLRNVYGTLRPDGLLRYRRVYLCVPKKNQKSTLAGGLTDYHLWRAGRDEGVNRTQKMYGVASAKDQAGIVYEFARDYVKRVPELSQQIRYLDSTRRLLRRDGRAIYAVISTDGDVQDGIEPVFAVFDELHRWKSEKAASVFDVMVKGAVNVPESLIWEITTMGEEFESPLWYEEHEFARHILDGSLISESFYAAIYGADERRIANDPEYWKSREARVVANPSHEDNGGYLKDERLVELLNEAIAKPGKRAAYLRLNLNVQVAEGETPEVDMEVWGAAPSPGGVDLRTWEKYDMDRLIEAWGLAGRQCVAGLDLAWTTDMAGMTLVFPPVETAEPWKLLLWAWLPEDKVAELERRTRAPLKLWKDQGFLRTSEGAEIKTLELLDQVEACSKIFDVREVTFDKWGGMKAACNLVLVPKGFTCVDIPQTYAGLTEATKKFLGLYRSLNLAHGNHPILRWHVSCLALATDGGDNAKPMRPKRGTSAKRIDLVASTVTGFARAIVLAPQASGEIEVW